VLCLLCLLCILSVLDVPGAVSLAAAQDRDPYLLQHTDGKLIFEAQIAADIRIIDNFDRALVRVFQKDKPRVFAYTVFGSFLTRLRMSDEDSNPVRYHRGQDHYNASFLENINRLQFGVTFLQGKFLGFPRTSQ
jgi:hypothetical protein